MAVQASASLEDISYPIAELDNCDSQEACFAYCDEPDHFDACIAFADANDLLTDEDIQKYETAEEALAQNGGPGGCTDQAACEAYCSDVNHMEECLTFASENHLMSEEELAQATQVLTAIQGGATLPGGCTDQETCEAYCSDTDHMDECLDFGVAAGMMTTEQAGQIKEQGTSMEDFVGPGGCDSEEACSVYCMEEANREECEAFFGDMGEAPEGVEDGYDEGQEEYDEEYQSSFVGPGGCTGEEACMSFCLDPANQETCASFFGSSESSDSEDHTEIFDQEYDSSDWGEATGFEGLSPEDIDLNLEEEGESESDGQNWDIPDEIEVTPDTEESSP